MGSLNILPVTVRVDGVEEGPNNNPTASLIGGQNVCFCNGPLRVNPLSFVASPELASVRSRSVSLLDGVG
jgi:hypothetical protein